LSKKVLGLDLDGVIFQFNKSYCDLFKEKFNIEFPPETSLYPDTWNYELSKATVSQIDEVWEEINNGRNYDFWRNLQPYEGAQDFLDRANEYFDEIHFITSRTGKDCKVATEDALIDQLGVFRPKVIISHYKVPDLIKIGATDFLDDRDKNFEDVLKGINVAERPKLWLLDRPWNRHYSDFSVQRIKDVNECLV
jgi:hypothetical protein